MRIELFFKTIFEFHSVISTVRDLGVTRVNLTNKVRNEPLLQYVATLRKELPHVDVCAHFSIKHQYQRNAEATFRGLEEFCVQAARAGCGEVLLVSGGGPKRELHSLNALQRLAAGGAAVPVDLGVAFNPYFPDAPLRNEERARLRAKVNTGVVSSVWLQFGSDPNALRNGLEFLRETLQGTDVRVVGSVFVPSRKLLAQMKFRPWNGVFLSEEYLSGVPEAEAITRRLLDLYREFGVQPLVETAIKGAADLTRAKALLGPDLSRAPPCA